MGGGVVGAVGGGGVLDGEFVELRRCGPFFLFSKQALCFFSPAITPITTIQWAGLDWTV